MLSIGKTEIKVDFTFFAVIGLLIFIDTSGTATLSLIASLFHEAGHLIAMFLCRSSVRKVTFYGGGICITSDMTLLTFWKRIFVLSAGCLFNFIIFLVGVFLFADSRKFLVFAVVNFVICIFNLMPVGYFDGAELLYIILNRLMEFKTAEMVKKIITIIFSVTVVFFILIYCFVYSGEISISFLFVVFYLILAQFIC